MDIPTFQELRSRNGQSALADAAALNPTEASYLQSFEKLRKRYPAELAKAVLETVLLRLRTKDKHSRGDNLYFTRESLEQSSSEAVSQHRARRFKEFPHVLDLCCGAGIDAIHLARAGCTVSAMDADPLKLAMARANAEVYGVQERIHFLEGDVLTMPLPAADAAFADPSRRDGERRFLDPSRYQPPLAAVLARFPAGFPLAAKIAPGVSHRDLEPLPTSELEFISSNGELKECVLWFGPLKSAQRRATVLPDHSLASDIPLIDPAPSEIREYLFDPDSAVIRAGLLPVLCEQLEAAPIDYGVAMLTGSKPADSPFADGYRVEQALPLHIGKLRDHLRAERVGRVTVLKRAIDVDVNVVIKQLKLTGTEYRHVILTKALGQRVAIVAQREVRF